VEYKDEKKNMLPFDYRKFPQDICTRLQTTSVLDGIFLFRRHALNYVRFIDRAFFLVSSTFQVHHDYMKKKK